MKNLKDLLANEKRKIEAAEAMRKDLRALTLSEKSFQLDQWKLSGLSTVYYLPNWISPEEEQEVMAHTRADGQFHSLTRRKLKVYGGIPVSHDDGMIPEEMPDWMQVIIDQLNKLRPLPGNHVLFNQYDDGQGIAAHRDGPLYSDYVQIVSLNGTAAIEFFIKEQPDLPSIKVFLEPRSLLIFTGEVYHKYHHVIHSRQEDVIDETYANREFTGLSVGTSCPRQLQRLSFTVRTVPRVSSLNSRELTPEQENELRRRRAVFYASVNESKSDI